jgi:hypothetical protein
MRSLIPSGLIVASLVLTGSAAMAASTQAHQPAANVTHPRVAAHAVVHRQYARAPYNFDVGQFIQSMLGGPLPPQYAQIVRNAVRESASRRSSGSYEYSPSYDNSPTVDSGSAAAESQAASDAENQAIEQMNDTNAMNASMAAAEQQNDAANAATLQTEINAGM